MKKFFCPEVSDGGFAEAEDLTQAKSILNCRYCGDCNGPTEYEDQTDVAADKAEACAAQIRKIAENPRIGDRTKHIQAVAHLCKLLRDLGYSQPVEAYIAIADLEGAWE